MKKRTIQSFFIALCIILQAILPINGYADSSEEPSEITAHTVNFLDFDGDVFAVKEVRPDSPLDLSDIDTDALYKRIDIYTEMRFLMWDKTVTSVTEDIDIQALYHKVTISADSPPNKSEYNFYGNISLHGLLVTITEEKQKASFDENGYRETEIKVYDITKGCTTNFNTVGEAFAESDTAELEIYPPGHNYPILIFPITFELKKIRGDVNKDGKVDSADASDVLTHYAMVSINEPGTITHSDTEQADVNTDGKIDAADAGLILSYYAAISVSDNVSWDDILNT